MKYIVWGAPYPGIDKDGTSREGCCDCYLLIDDCVRLQRAMYVQKGIPIDLLQDDEKLLKDFITIHWAWVEEYDA